MTTAGDPDVNNNTLKLCDFGAARTFSETVEMTAAGTFAYMAPEASTDAGRCLTSCLRVAYGCKTVSYQQDIAKEERQGGKIKLTLSQSVVVSCCIRG